ncbi:MAG: hypothetical protein ABIZ05_13280, partial [Pseudonocardiaceae bacterium]
NLRGDLAGGTLCLLTKDDDEVIGPVLPFGGHFMWLRPQADSPLRAPEPSPVRSMRGSARTSTALAALTLIDNDSFRFLLQLQLRGARGFRRTKVHDPITRTVRHGVFIEALDGSYAQAIAYPEVDGQLRVMQVGPRRLWDTVEATHQLWQQLGQPNPDRFGVVANSTTQFIWFDNDDGWYQWPLPFA